MLAGRDDLVDEAGREGLLRVEDAPVKIMYLSACSVRFERPRTTPGPGKRPTAASGVPKRAVSSATTRSQTIVSSQPPPSAWPWTAAIVGFESSSTARNAPSASCT